MFALPRSYESPRRDRHIFQRVYHYLQLLYIAQLKRSKSSSVGILVILISESRGETQIYEIIYLKPQKTNIVQDLMISLGPNEMVGLSVNKIINLLFSSGIFLDVMKVFYGVEPP